MSVIGYSGPRLGMTPWQRREVRSFLLAARPAMVVHGDCVGGDAEFDAIAAELGVRRRARPCDIVKMRARCQAEEIRHPRPPLVRNRYILDDAGFMIFTPATVEEVRRSGTWATIRAAQAVGKPSVYFWPDQRVSRIGTYTYPPNKPE